MQGTHLFPRVPDRLLEQMDEVGRAELAQRGKRICAGINRLGQDLLVDPVAVALAEASKPNRRGHELGNSWRNHCDKHTRPEGGGLRYHGQARATALSMPGGWLLVAKSGKPAFNDAVRSEGRWQTASVAGCEAGDSDKNLSLCCHHQR